jgi:CRP-like cAMP-binding protein
MKNTLGYLPSLRGMPVSASAPPDSLLTQAQRRRLARISTRVRLRARAVIFRQGDKSDSVFITAVGVVRTFRDLPSGRRRVTAFLFPNDIFGLAQHGKYVNTAQAVTEVVLHRLPLQSLEKALRDDGRLQFPFLYKVAHELRQAQRQSIALTRRDAVGRVAMFFSMLERERSGHEDKSVIVVPMSRSDIANYLGLSLETVSRATARLTRQGIIAVPDRHAVRVLDRARFEHLVASA